MDFKVPAEVTTDRLLLRQFREADWSDLHDHYSDSDRPNTPMVKPCLKAKPGEPCAA